MTLSASALKPLFFPLKVKVASYINVKNGAYRPTNGEQAAADACCMVLTKSSGYSNGQYISRDLRTHPFACNVASRLLQSSVQAPGPVVPNPTTPAYRSNQVPPLITRQKSKSPPERGPMQGHRPPVSGLPQPPLLPSKVLPRPAFAPHKSKESSSTRVNDAHQKGMSRPLVTDPSVASFADTSPRDRTPGVLRPLQSKPYPVVSSMASQGPTNPRTTNHRAMAPTLPIAQNTPRKTFTYEPTAQRFGYVLVLHKG